MSAAIDNPEDESRKRKNRLEQNRISARESRKRKKVMIEELQRSVALLSNENRLLNQQNQLLRHQLIQLAPSTFMGMPGLIAHAAATTAQAGAAPPTAAATGADPTDPAAAAAIGATTAALHSLWMNGAAAAAAATQAPQGQAPQTAAVSDSQAPGIKEEEVADEDTEEDGPSIDVDEKDV